MRLLFALLLWTVLVAVPPTTTALPTGAEGEHIGGQEPMYGFWNPVLVVEEDIVHEEEKFSTEEDLEDAVAENIDHILYEIEESVQDAVVVEDPDVLEDEDQERKQNSDEISDPVVVELKFINRDVGDSYDKLLNKKERETYSEGTEEDQNNEYERRFDASVKLRTELIGRSSELLVSSETEPSVELNKDLIGSPHAKQDTKVVSERSLKRENSKFPAQAKPVARDINEESETTDREIAQSKLNEIVFEREAESTKEVDTQDLEIAQSEFNAIIFGEDSGSAEDVDLKDLEIAQSEFNAIIFGEDAGSAEDVDLKDLEIAQSEFNAIIFGEDAGSAEDVDLKDMEIAQSEFNAIIFGEEAGSAENIYLEDLEIAPSEFIAIIFGEDSESVENVDLKDLEIAQSEFNAIIFGEETVTAEGFEVSDSEAGGTQNKNVDQKNISSDDHTEESLVYKRKASYEESTEDGVGVLATDEPRILSPAEFYGLFVQNDSESIVSEDD